MKFRQTIFALIVLSMVAALVACSSSSSKPVVQPISVAFSGTPPTSLAENSTSSLTATVSNDTASGGITWACTPANACGGFSSTSTASGAATIFTAPATVPSGGTVSITATSVTDATKSASAMVSITAASSLADGTYVFSLAGQDAASGYLYYAAGAFTVASGAVTAGEQDFVDYYAGNSFDPTTLMDAITGGTVTITGDGNFQISLTTADTYLGAGGVETLNGTLVSGVRALINEFDAGATSSGELDLQTSTSAGQGGYAFFVNGGDFFGCSSSFGGIVNVDGSGGAIDGTGSVFDLNDACDGVLLTNQVIDPSTVSSPDSFGRVTVSLDLTTSTVGGIGLAGYVVDGNRIRLVENSTDPNDAFNGVTGGTAFYQNANTGTFANTTIEGSSFVFGSNGQGFNGYLQVAGVLTTNVDGTTVNGTLNFNDLTETVPQAPLAFTGTYTVDPTGRVTLSNLSDGATFSFNAQLYLDGNGHAAFATMDSTDTVAGYAFPQTGGGTFTAASFAGNYGFDATGIDWNSYEELDAVGPVTADGVSALNGTVDLNLLYVAQTPGVALTDGFSAVDPSGFLTGTMTGLDTSFATQDNFTYYLVDATKAVAIQNDPNQLTLGYFELQQ